MKNIKASLMEKGMLYFGLLIVNTMLAGVDDEVQQIRLLLLWKFKAQGLSSIFWDRKSRFCKSRSIL